MDWFGDTAEEAIRLSHAARQAIQRGAVSHALDIAQIAMQKQLTEPQTCRDTVALARETRLNRAAAAAQAAQPMPEVAREGPRLAGQSGPAMEVHH